MLMSAVTVPNSPVIVPNSAVTVPNSMVIVPDSAVTVPSSPMEVLDSQEAAPSFPSLFGFEFKSFSLVHDGFVGSIGGSASDALVRSINLGTKDGH